MKSLNALHSSTSASTYVHDTVATEYMGITNDDMKYLCENFYCHKT
jgi:hypothetical protein